MSNEFLKFDDTYMKKQEFHYSKIIVDINDVDINKIFISGKSAYVHRDSSNY